MKACFTILAICLLAITNSFGQHALQDLQLIERYDALKSKKEARQKRKVTPLNFIYHISIDLYQSQLSPQLDANCAFEITCSRFSRLMVQDFGLLKGYFLTFDRLGRCNHISVVESNPLRLNSENKIIEHTHHLRLRQ